MSPALRADIIARFEADQERRPSAMTVDGQAAKNDYRTGTQLECVGPEWKDVIDAIVPALHSSLNVFARKVDGLQVLIQTEGLSCTAPIIERVGPGQGFAWHYDQTYFSRDRVLTGILYLRTLTDGGFTEFREQKINVRPEAGKIVLFPPYWTHYHRGASPSREPKYVMTFF